MDLASKEQIEKRRIRSTSVEQRRQNEHFMSQRRKDSENAYEQWLTQKDMLLQWQESDHAAKNFRRLTKNPFSCNQGIPWLPPSPLIFEKKLFIKRRKLRSSGVIR